MCIRRMCSISQIDTAFRMEEVEEHDSLGLDTARRGGVVCRRTRPPKNFTARALTSLTDRKVAVAGGGSRLRGAGHWDSGRPVDLGLKARKLGLQACNLRERIRELNFE